MLRPVLEHLGGGLSPGEQPVEGIGLIDLINRPCRDSIDAPLVGYKPIIPMVYGCGLIVGDLASAKDAIPPGRNERLKRRGSNFLEKFQVIKMEGLSPSWIRSLFIRIVYDLIFPTSGFVLLNDPQYSLFFCLQEVWDVDIEVWFYLTTTLIVEVGALTVSNPMEVHRALFFSLR